MTDWMPTLTHIAHCGLEDNPTCEGIIMLSSTIFIVNLRLILSGGAYPLFSRERERGSGWRLTVLIALKLLRFLPRLVPDLGDIDGVNQWPAVAGMAPSNRTEFLVNIDQKKNNAALRMGEWKLFTGKKFFFPRRKKIGIFGL